MPPMTSLPPPVDPTLISSLLTSINLPPPSTIAVLPVTASFHTIYLITYTLPPPCIALPPSPDGSLALILRISGPHVPHIKTANEVAVMTWLQRHTSIPVPQIIHHDSTQDNPLGREYTLLEKIPGQSVDAMYPSLSEAIKIKLVNQLIDILVELNAHSWSHIGGLHLSHDNTITPGPLLDDTFWFLPDIETEFGSDECVRTLNPVGPYASHADYMAGYIAVFIHAIEVHDSLAWMRDLIPRLGTLAARLPALELSRKLVLAHKDLHFANVMATPDGRVTGILDWEFAAVVPALRWDPVRAFLADLRYTQESHDEQTRLRGVFERELDRRGVGRWWEEGVTEQTSSVWEVVRFTRAIVEVCPRGEKVQERRGWRDTVECALTRLGV